MALRSLQLGANLNQFAAADRTCGTSLFLFVIVFCIHVTGLHRRAYRIERTRSILAHVLNAARHDGRLIRESVSAATWEALSGGFAAIDGLERKATDEAE